MTKTKEKDTKKQKAVKTKLTKSSNNESKALANTIRSFFASGSNSALDLGEHEEDFNYAHKSKYSDTESPAEHLSNNQSMIRQPGDLFLELPSYRGTKVSRKEILHDLPHNEMSESTEMDDDNGQEDLLDQLTAIQAKESQQLSNLLSQNTHKEKAEHTKNQTSLLDALCATRIAIQHPLVNSNQLPATGNIFDLFSCSQGAIELLNSCHNNIINLLSLFLRIHLNCAAETPTLPPFYSIENLWNYMEQCYSSDMDHIKPELDSWWQKAHLHSQTDLLRKRFNTIQQGIQAQVAYLLQNPERTILKTKLFRHDLPILQPKTAILSTSDGFSSYPHIYDDTDFYQNMLRDIISSKVGGQDLSDTLNIQGKNKTKSQDRIITSKGRAVRYDVHEKLANFTAPSSWSVFLSFTRPTGLPGTTYEEDSSDMWPDERIDALFSSLPRI